MITKAKEIPRHVIEREVEKRLIQHCPGVPGIHEGIPTGDGQRELVMRDKDGMPVGVLGYDPKNGFESASIRDFAVAKAFRRLGIATALVAEARKRGAKGISSSFFTKDGLAFVRSLEQG